MDFFVLHQPFQEKSSIFLCYRLFGVVFSCFCSNLEVARKGFSLSIGFLMLAISLTELQVPSGPDLLMNSLPIMPRPFSVPLVELSSANAVVNASIQEEKEDKKILKWKLTKKIYRIYADWIDDLVPPHLLATKADS